MSVPSSELGPPTHSPASECVSSVGPAVEGRSNTLLRIGGWGDPIRTAGKKTLHFVNSVVKAKSNRYSLSGIEVELIHIDSENLSLKKSC